MSAARCGPARLGGPDDGATCASLRPSSSWRSSSLRSSQASERRVSRLSSLLCRIRGHRYGIVFRHRSPSSSTVMLWACRRCGQLDLPLMSRVLASLPETRVILDRVAARLADAASPAPPLGTAATALPVPEATPEGSTRLPARLSESGTGADESWWYQPEVLASKYGSLTGAPVPAASSTSTPTRSVVSRRSQRDS